MKKSLALACFLLFAAAVRPASATNIVLNDSFESGTADWTFQNFYIYSAGHTGTDMAGTGCVGSSSLTNCYIAQTLTTTVGESYDLSFWVAEYLGATSQFRLKWDGNDVTTVTNPNNNSCTYDGTFHCDWLQFSYTNLIATSTSTVLQVFGRQDPGGIFFDDFDVHTSAPETSPVPEPASMTLLGTGVAAVIARRRKKARQGV
jgi:hypothetical protein